MNRIDQLTEELKAYLKTAQDIAATADDEGRDFTDAERAQVTDAMGKAGEAKKKLQTAKGDAKMRAAVAELGEGIGLADGPREKRTPSGLAVPDRNTSVGKHFVESQAYKALVSRAPSGFGEKMRVQSDPVGYKSLLRSKTLVTGASDTSAGAMVPEDWRGLLVGMEAFQRPLMLRDVVSPGTTTSDTVEYARITATTNAAAPTAESTATATPGSPSPATGVKPESGFTTEKVSTPVRTIAHWIPVTKRALSDAAQVRTLIDNFLSYGLEEELEDQMISGNNVGENFEGLSIVSGVQSQAFDTNHLVTARRAKTKVRTVGRAMANAYVLHPDDLEEIDLSVDLNNQYYFGGPAAAGGARTLWGIPVVESEAVPSGTGYVGDWRRAILWDREQSSISVSDSHSDFFIRNMVAILAELRAAFGIVQPSAFVEISFTGS